MRYVLKTLILDMVFIQNEDWIMPPATHLQETPPDIAQPANADRINELLAEAMKHPGIGDIMRIYSAFEEANKAQVAYRYFQAPFCEDSVSTSSSPIFK